jgi:DNA-directed RNA polymerase specialized sigma24 family protein
MARSTFTSEQDYFNAFDEFADGIFRHCYLRAHCREKAKELTMEAFSRLWQFIADGNVVDSARLLLYRMSHELIERERAKGRVPVSEPVGNDGKLDFSVLEMMDVEEQPAAILHYVDGFSLPDIKTILGGSSETYELALRKGASLLRA